MRVSETSKCREKLAMWCQGNGLDLGYGGDPILKSSVTVDLPVPYSVYEPRHHRNLSGDAQDLYWFKDEVLDYVYSSHLLEDFDDTEAVLREWLRVLKLGGHLVLYLPDEKRYRLYCESKGKRRNRMHKHEDFSIKYVLEKLISIGGVKVQVMEEERDGYSFSLVAEKVSRG